MNVHPIIIKECRDSVDRLYSEEVEQHNVKFSQPTFMSECFFSFLILTNSCEIMKVNHFVIQSETGRLFEQRVHFCSFSVHTISTLFLLLVLPFSFIVSCVSGKGGYMAAVSLSSSLQYCP